MRLQSCDDTADPESLLVAAICREPQNRNAYVALADHLEQVGKMEESRHVYRGNLPITLQRRHELNPWPHGTSRRMASCQRLSSYSTEHYELQPPLNADPNRNSVFEHDAIRTDCEYVDLMSDCTLLYDGRNRLYIDSEGVRNSEHSTMNAWLLTPRSRERDSARNLPGLSVMLAARNSHNFYHWHFDCLPALGMIEAAGIELDDIDHILMDKRNSGFQHQMLLAAGIREEQIRYIDVDHCHLQCERMLMVRVQNQQGMAQSRRHLDWVRRVFLSAAACRQTISSSGQRRIAIRRDVRGFADPDRCYATLQSMGYECFQPETMDYLDQVRLFAEASHIVAPHGAGLSLLAFCRPDTEVHEFHGAHVQPCFWSLSSALGLQYHVYNCSDITSGETTRSNRNLAERLASSIHVTDTQLRAIGA